MWLNRGRRSKGKAGLSGARRESFSSVFHNKMMIMYKMLRRNAGSGALEGVREDERALDGVSGV